MKYIKTYENKTKYKVGDIVYLEPNHDWYIYYPFVKIIEIDDERGGESYYKAEIIYGENIGRSFYVRYDYVLRKATQEEVDIYENSKKYNI